MSVTTGKSYGDGSSVNTRKLPKSEFFDQRSDARRAAMQAARSEPDDKQGTRATKVREWAGRKTGEKEFGLRALMAMNRAALRAAARQYLFERH